MEAKGEQLAEEVGSFSEKPWLWSSRQQGGGSFSTKSTLTHRSSVVPSRPRLWDTPIMLCAIPISCDVCGTWLRNGGSTSCCLLCDFDCCKSCDDTRRHSSQIAGNATKIAALEKEPRLIVYTSGSTGTPKDYGLVMHSTWARTAAVSTSQDMLIFQLICITA